MAFPRARAYTEIMEIRPPAAAFLVAAALAACSTPASRIRGAQAEFDAYAPRVQEAIRAGRVEPGFSKEQASLALGRPDRIVRSRGAGEEEWIYRVVTPGLRPGAEVGAGASGWGPYDGERLGVFLGAADDEPEETFRVVFKDGLVVEISGPEERAHW
jgi:hypothetical protein